MFLKVSTLFLGRRAVVRSKQYSFRYIHYVQGQEPEPKIREYFYFIDHQGQVRNIPSQNFLFHVDHTVCYRCNVTSFCCYMNSDHLSFTLQLFLDDARIKNFTSCFKGEQLLKKKQQLYFNAHTLIYLQLLTVIINIRQSQIIWYLNDPQQEISGIFSYNIIGHQDGDQAQSDSIFGYPGLTSSYNPSHQYNSILPLI